MWIWIRYMHANVYTCITARGLPRSELPGEYCGILQLPSSPIGLPDWVGRKSGVWTSKSDAINQEIQREWKMGWKTECAYENVPQRLYWDTPWSEELTKRDTFSFHARSDCTWLLHVVRISRHRTCICYICMLSPTAGIFTCLCHIY